MGLFFSFALSASWRKVGLRSVKSRSFIFHLNDDFRIYVFLKKIMFSNNHYNKKLKEYARNLRSNKSTKAEKCLWKNVLSRKLTGERFLRQRPIVNYIVDFLAPEINLIIEIDGSSHSFKGNIDAIRQRNLEKLGYVFMRFSENEVLNDLNNVKEKIAFGIYCLRNK